MTDKSGTTWAADIGYDGGETAITGEPIQGAIDQALYQPNAGEMISPMLSRFYQGNTM